MGTSRNKSPSSGGCFAGVLRIILCKGKLQTHPAASDSSDLNKTKTSPSSSAAQEKQLNCATSITAPGVVARLMGLDAVPLSTKWMSARAIEQSALRSRSVNFMDYLLDLDRLSNEDEAFHRRVKSSLSFREVPELLHGDRNLLVLYLKDQETAINVKLKSRKIEDKENHAKKVKTSRKKRATHKRREPRRSFSLRGSKNDKEVQEESEFMMKVKKKEQQKVEIALKSLVSVIDEAEISRREFSSNEGESFHEGMDERNCIKEKVERRIKEEKVTERGELDEWKMRNEGTEEICRELEKHILDKLLVKLVQEFPFTSCSYPPNLTSVGNGFWL